MPNRTGKNTTFSRKKQILALILNELRARTQRCGKKKGDFPQRKSPHLLDCRRSSRYESTEPRRSIKAAQRACRRGCRPREGLRRWCDVLKDRRAHWIAKRSKCEPAKRRCPSMSVYILPWRASVRWS